MKQLGVILVCCAMLGACTVVDAGVGRGALDWPTQLDANAYAEFGWSTNDFLLSMDLVGGPHAYTLVRVDIWRLLHLELGLLGFGLGLGPLQIGAGVGPYAPGAPGMITRDDPLDG